MAKLQEIVRKNGSVVNNITLPKEAVEQSGFKKGDELQVKCLKEGLIEIKKEGE